nr:hypothetical protein [Nanoarchaeum sp.]
MELSDLVSAISSSWGKDTCYPGSADKWTESNPYHGQCAITALVVQDYLGGEILSCSHAHHYWNRLTNGQEVDLTKEQFPAGTQICLDEIKTREYILDSPSAIKATTPERYLLLKKRVEEKLQH